MNSSSVDLPNAWSPLPFDSGPGSFQDGGISDEQFSLYLDEMPEIPDEDIVREMSALVIRPEREEDKEATSLLIFLLLNNKSVPVIGFLLLKFTSNKSSIFIFN